MDQQSVRPNARQILLQNKTRRKYLKGNPSVLHRKLLSIHDMSSIQCCILMEAPVPRAPPPFPSRARYSGATLSLPSVTSSTFSCSSAAARTSCPGDRMPLRVSNKASRSPACTVGKPAGMPCAILQMLCQGPAGKLQCLTVQRAKHRPPSRARRERGRDHAGDRGRNHAGSRVGSWVKRLLGQLDAQARLSPPGRGNVLLRSEGSLVVFRLAPQSWNHACSY